MLFALSISHYLHTILNTLTLKRDISNFFPFPPILFPKKNCFCHALIKTIFRLLLPRINSLRQVRFALPQSLPLLANPALSLENWIATMNMSMTAAAIVLLTSQSHVSPTTQPLLVLDSGKFHLLLQLALQTAVAARVSGGDKIVKS